MNAKQRRFADEYITCFNATQAAIKAGYSKKTARQIGQRLLTYVDIKLYIEAELEKIHEEKTADAKEVMEYLTSVLRGESKSHVVVVEGVGEGCSTARIILKNPDERERLKAAQLIGKTFGMFKDSITVELEPVQIVNDITE